MGEWELWRDWKEKWKRPGIFLLIELVAKGAKVLWSKNSFCWEKFCSPTCYLMQIECSKTIELQESWDWKIGLQIWLKEGTILVLLWRLCFSEAGLYVWGSNSFGQLGIGKIDGCITRPTLCEVSLTFDLVMEMLCLSLFGIQGGHGNPGKKI